MKKIKTSTVAMAISLGSMSLLACGGGDSNTDTDVDDVEIDGMPEPDAEITPTCTTVDTGNQTAGDNPGQFFFEIATDLGAGGDTYGTIELYEDFGKDSFVGTFALDSAGQNDNYATCATCFRAIGLNEANDAIEVQWFQTGGSVTFETDPMTGSLKGSVSDLTMIEVTIDPDNMYTSTPVPGGTCLNLGSFDLKSVPAGWTCDAADYDDGTTCNCECGAYDIDCEDGEAAVDGCAAGEFCDFDGACATSCDVMGGEGCTDSACGFYSASNDQCYPTADIDAAAIGAACTNADALFCALDTKAGIARGLCDTEEGTPCREACDSDDDCNEGEACEPVVGSKGYCHPTIAADSCQTATALTLGAATAGTTVGGINDYGNTMAACTGYAELGHDVVYSLALTAGQEITVTLAATFDSAIAVIGPDDAALCDASPLECVAGADDAGNDETVTFTADAAGTYFIVVDGYGANTEGTFTVTAALAGA